MNTVRSFAECLREWYRRNRRDLPWRRTRDAYAIWVSEVMLQQTRVAAVIPYYERFLTRFPDIETLASAKEQDLLAAWAGLGYYSRARNLQRAAQAMDGRFPSTYAGILALPGVGDYTAAAVASIAFELPHVAVDGNVLRVAARLSNDAGDIRMPAVRSRSGEFVGGLADGGSPGEFNQAMMELGATVCLPAQPRCLLCPVSEFCEARRAGTQDLVPSRPSRAEPVALERTVLLMRRGRSTLLWQRPADSRKLAGFWELPEPEHFTEAPAGRIIGQFRHSVTNHRYLFRVMLVSPAPASVCRACKKIVKWCKDPDQHVNMAVSTTARKALAIYKGVRQEDE